MSDLVTGEAVELGLRPARLLSRAVAVLIDLVVTWTVFLLCSVALLSLISSLDVAAMAALQVGLVMLVLVGGPVALETLTHGRSIGKIACGLRVVREDGGPIRFRHALVRGAVGVVEIQLLLGTVACIASLVSERGRRVGDVFAGTLVIRERIPTVGGVGLPPPPPRQRMFVTLDLSRVPDGLWLGIRQYLLRAGQLDPAVSRSMAERLAQDLSRLTGAPPPAGMDPVTYLTAVVAERQTRDTQRVLGSQGNPPPGTGQAPGGGAPPGTAPGRPPAGQPAAPAGAEPIPGAPGVPERSGGGAPSQNPGRRLPSPDAEESPTPAPRTGFVPPA
ncbi:RDD family protein [Streptomyces sp. NPDC005438]|uniref:RDD family protein n=1 Tax=Streptomyces sp. NPDC005438 TaxID=3156880 RepID=UPI0033B60C8D